MRILAGYLARLFVVRFALLLVGLTAVAALVDVVAHADSVLGAAGAGPLSLFRYAGLRLPEIGADLMPLSVLLGALLTFAGLARHSELVIIVATGVSQLKLIALLLPAVVLVALSQFVIEDQVVPESIRELRAWGVGEYGGSSRGADGTRAHWLRVEGDVLRIGRIEAGGRALAAVTVFRRDGAGTLIERIDAGSAEYADGRWTLYDVTQRSMSDNSIKRLIEARWEVSLAPARLLVSSTRPEELSLAGLRRFLGDERLGSLPQYHYQTWLHQRLAAPFGTLLMVLVAVPLAGRFRRSGRTAPALAGGVAIGFGYLVFAGFTLSLGKGGLLLPAAAAWLPVVVLACLGITLALHAERA